jgi:hypothetical protein
MEQRGEQGLVAAFVAQAALKLSTKPFFNGLPGEIWCHSTRRSYDRRRMADEVSSVPLSLTTP